MGDGLPVDGLRVDRRDDGVALLTLDRPQVLNAIDMALAAALSHTLADLCADAAVRAIVLTGSGRAFCSGFDIAELGGFDAGTMLHAFATRDPLIHRVARCPKPVIAALNGPTYGAGALIAAACDIRVGCAATRFKVTATGYGGANATWTLPRIVGAAKAKEILMTGRVVEAAEALAIGLVNQLADDPLAAALAMAAAIARNPPEGVQGVKALVDAGQDRSLDDAFRAEFAWMVDSILAGQKAGGEVFSGFLAKS